MDSESFDNINSLPVDQNKPTQHEINTVNKLFTTHQKDVNLLYNEFKSVLLIGILFIIISLPQTHNFLTKNISILSKSNNYTLLFKSILLMISFWLINNYYLSKKVVK